MILTLILDDPKAGNFNLNIQFCARCLKLITKLFSLNGTVEKSTITDLVDHHKRVKVMIILNTESTQAPTNMEESVEMGQFDDAMDDT